jgi:pyruvate/2-oxoglutarate dehydrogenase complex dihydrolipoamide acyltransferase (E2) component
VSGSAQNDTLADALARAAGRVVGEAHDARNQHHGYRYTSAEAVIAGARRALAAEGVTAHVTSWVVSWGWGGDVTPEAREWAAGIGRLVLTVARGGESIELTREWPVMVGKGRPADKGAAGAETQALAYALRGLLLIDRPEEEDTAVDRRDDRSYEPPRRAEAERPQARRAEPPAPAPAPAKAPAAPAPTQAPEPKPATAAKAVTWPAHVMALVEEAKRLGLAKTDVEQAAREVGVQARALTPEQCAEIVALWRLHAAEAKR